MRKETNYGIFNQISIISLLFVSEFFLVIAAMAANYKIMAIMSIFSCFMAVMSLRKISLKVNKFTVAFLLFIFYVLLRSGLELRHVDIFFYTVGLIFVIAIGNSSKVIYCEKLLHWLKWLGLFFSIGVFLQFAFTDYFKLFYHPLFGPEFQDSIKRQVIHHHMYTGWTSQTATTSLNIILGLISSYLLLQKNKKKSEYLYFFIMIFALLLVGKRGPTLFMIISLVTLYILENKISIKTTCKFLFFVSLIFSFLLIANFYSEKINSNSRNFLVRMHESMNKSNDDVSNGRFALWEAAIEAFSREPIFGIGWRNYALTITKGMEVHNTFLQVLTETGILGLILYLCLVIYCIVDSIKYFFILPKNSDLIIGIKLSIMIQFFLILYNLTGNILYDYFTLMCLFVAYGLYLNITNNYKKIIVSKYQNPYLSYNSYH